MTAETASITRNFLVEDDDLVDELLAAINQQGWGGLKMEFVIQPGMQIEESYCSPQENAKFEERFMKPAAKPSQ